MEVAVRPMCAAPGCITSLRSKNVSRGTCDKHDREGFKVPKVAGPKKERKPRPKPVAVEYSPWDSCERGHVLNRTGYTRKGKCFECVELYSKSGARGRRYFYLYGFNEALNAPLRQVYASIGFSYAALKEYALGYRAPEDRALEIAKALGVSVSRLKGLGD